MEKNIETIKDKNNNVIAMIIYDSFSEPGTTFFTPPDYSQQLAFISRSSGESIEAHVHNVSERNIHLTQETLFIKKGKLKVNFYDGGKNYFDSRVLGGGDIILLSGGGHGFEFLTDVKMVEVKQGPYLNDNDKIRFKGVEK